MEPIADGERPLSADRWSPKGRRRLSFVIVNMGYLAVTCSESLLAPVFPIAAREFRLDLGEAGLAFALLALSIAVGNVGGGFLLARRGPRPGAVIGLVVAAAGGALAASSSEWAPFLVAQVVLGLGSGIFFASGLSAAGDLSYDRRRGLAMGFFGVSFSGGLAMAALLVAVAGAGRWRVTFAVAAGLTTVAAIGMMLISLPPRAPRPPRTSWRGIHRVLWIPLAVGGMATASQYGTVSFMPSFAVSVWGLAPAAAAVMLAAARILSIPGKLSAGRRADRMGALATAGQIGLLLAALGLCWTLVPVTAAGALAAVGFAAGVSGLGPLANVLALESFGGRGVMLGLFRSAQIGLGAVTSALLGAASERFGLRPTLGLAAVLPGLLGLAAWYVRRRTVAETS